MWGFNKTIEKRKPRKDSNIVEVPIITVNKPNGIGNIYTENSVSDMLEIFNESENKKSFCGGLVYSGVAEMKSRNVKDVTHTVEHLYLEDGFLIAVVKFLEHERAKLAKGMLKEGKAIVRPTIHGYADTVTKEVIVTEILGFDVLGFDDVSSYMDLIDWICIKK